MNMLDPNRNGSAGQQLLKQLMALQSPGGAMSTDASGTPNFVSNGFLGKIMQGNPGGLIGAILKRQSAPVNPGSPPLAGDPAYFPGGQGPMAGGSPMGGGLLGGGGGFLGGKMPFGMLSGLFGGG